MGETPLLLHPRVCVLPCWYLVGAKPECTHRWSLDHYRWAPLGKSSIVTPRNINDPCCHRCTMYMIGRHFTCQSDQIRLDSKVWLVKYCCFMVATHWQWFVCCQFEGHWSSHWSFIRISGGISGVDGGGQLSLFLLYISLAKFSRVNWFLQTIWLKKLLRMDESKLNTQPDHSSHFAFKT